ncbi:hypothetical protein [Streptomyces sp. NPDC051286]|uniref:hypothetical protein n=1 Tax=Streptomyces sp. NPDC051286 TaxID=3365647 RepID=UPI0037B347A3
MSEVSQGWWAAGKDASPPTAPFPRSGWSSGQRTGPSATGRHFLGGCRLRARPVAGGDHARRPEPVHHSRTATARNESSVRVELTAKGRVRHAELKPLQRSVLARMLDGATG